MAAQTVSTTARSLTAAVLSGLLPGAGHFMAGDRRKARTLIIVDIVILAVLAFFFRDKVSILTAWIQPTSLALMMVANIVLLGYRIWAASDAYITARGPADRSGRAPGVMVLAGTIAIGLVLVIPHVVFGYYDVVQYDLITSVFADERDSASASSQETITPVTSAQGTVTEETVVVAGGDPWDGVDRLNILLIGGDFGEGRAGIRTDTMITVSIDPATGETAMFSVPRNWTQAPLPAGMGVWDCDCYPELINELWTAGEEHPDAFPGPGTPSENAVKGVISEFLGIPIHYYAMVNLDGFVDIVDALGGVEIYVPTAVVDDKYPSEDGTTTEQINIQPGWQNLDGHLALAYSRSRNQDNDYFRMSRQRCVIEAMMEQANPTDLLTNFGKFAEVIKETMITDIPVATLPDLVELLPKVDLESVVSIRFIPPEYHLRYRDDDTGYAVANVGLVHEHVDLVISDPQRAITELGLEPLDDLCAPPPGA
ncbi:MAG: LCP family protein [Actinomycetota bacterium]